MGVFFIIVCGCSLEKGGEWNSWVLCCDGCRRVLGHADFVWIEIKWCEPDLVLIFVLHVQ